MSGASFLQKVFNKISLQKNEKLWMSSDESRLEERLRLLATFPDTKFSTQLKLDSATSAKNGKLSAGQGAFINDVTQILRISNPPPSRLCHAKMTILLTTLFRVPQKSEPPPP